MIPFEVATFDFFCKKIAVPPVFKSERIILGHPGTQQHFHPAFGLRYPASKMEVQNGILAPGAQKMVS